MNLSIIIRNTKEVDTHTNFHLYHYAGNNPVKYLDPDGRETYDSEITKDQYDKSQLSKQFTWEQVQQFFTDNPNAVLQRYEDEIYYRKILDKKDLVDPNACNFDLVLSLAGIKLNSKFIESIIGFINNSEKLPRPLKEHRTEIGRIGDLKARGEKPNSSIDLVSSDNKLLQRRYYDKDGNAYLDIDFSHGNGDGSHSFPHMHRWDWSKKTPRQRN